MASPKRKPTGCAESITRPHLDRQQCVAAIAMLIADSRPAQEEWLFRGLKRAALAVSWAAQKANEHPNREDLRDQMNAALDAVNLLRGRLTETTFQRVLAAAAEDNLDADSQTYLGLGSLKGRLEIAMAGIPTGSNPHKHDPGTNSPQAVCALSIAVAWRIARKTLPPHTSPEPQKACRLLWTLAGLSCNGWSDNLAGWKKHLRRAKDDLARGTRPELERLFEMPAR